MSLFEKLISGSVKPVVGADESRGDIAAPFTPVRTEDYKIDPKTKWLVIEPDIFPGEEIVMVMKPEYLAEAEKENPGLVIYQLSEIKALMPHEHDTEFRKKIHHAKKLFGGSVRELTAQELTTV